MSDRDMDIVRQMRRNHRKRQVLEGYGTCDECKVWAMKCRRCAKCVRHCTCGEFNLVQARRESRDGG